LANAAFHVLPIEQAKGKKDRYVLLSQRIRETIQTKILAFEGYEKSSHISTRRIQSIMNYLALVKMGISPQYVDDIATIIGIGGAMDFFVRKVDGLKFGELSIKNVELDFGEIDPKSDLRD